MDLFTESNFFDLKINENAMLVDFFVPQDFIDRNRPRRIPQKLPRSLSDAIVEEEMTSFSGVVSVTCNKSPLVFEYADSQLNLEYLDN